MKPAAARAAPLLKDSFVRRYVTMVVSPAKTGAKKTQTFLRDTGSDIWCSPVCIADAVIISPGYTVCPTQRPSGYHDRVSNQFANSHAPLSLRNCVARKLNCGSYSWIMLS